jgi:hypothetical protein
MPPEENTLASSTPSSPPPSSAPSPAEAIAVLGTVMSHRRPEKALTFVVSLSLVGSGVWLGTHLAALPVVVGTGTIAVAGVSSMYGFGTMPILLFGLGGVLALMYCRDLFGDQVFNGVRDAINTVRKAP